MKITKEQVIKAKSAKSVEELLALAKENGVELTEEQAKTYFVELRKYGELSDDELETVAGGSKTPAAKYNKDDYVLRANRRWRVTEREYDATNCVWTYTLCYQGEYDYNVWETYISGLCN